MAKKQDPQTSWVKKYIKRNKKEKLMKKHLKSKHINCKHSWMNYFLRILVIS